MITHFQHQRATFAYRVLSALIALTFLFSVITPPTPVYAQLFPQGFANLPLPGTMVTMSPGFTPPMVTGITVHPENPLEFDFIIFSGDDRLQGETLTQESTRLIKYFLAALTVPEEEMWVNLSPYEDDRIVPKGFGDTEMGRDLLAQDYILKQLTASLMYPENELGEKFWKKVRAKAYEQFGTTEIPMNTFNKVWIVPEEAVVYEHGQSAFVVKSHLKVMLEEDYIALQKNMGIEKYGLNSIVNDDAEIISGISSEVVREVLIPEIEKEVNQGETFANLRQIYNSAILAAWYAQNLKDGLLGQVYVGKNKTAGVETDDKQANQKIYEQYLEAFKKGVYNYIREDYDPATEEVIPRKYFSGGANITRLEIDKLLKTLRSENYEDLDSQQKQVVDHFSESGPGTFAFNVDLVEIANGKDADQIAQIVKLSKETSSSSPVNIEDFKSVIEEGKKRLNNFADQKIIETNRAMEKIEEAIKSYFGDDANIISDPTVFVSNKGAPMPIVLHKNRQGIIQPMHVDTTNNFVTSEFNEQQGTVVAAALPLGVRLVNLTFEVDQPTEDKDGVIAALKKTLRFRNIDVRPLDATAGFLMEDDIVVDESGISIIPYDEKTRINMYVWYREDPKVSVFATLTDVPLEFVSGSLREGSKVARPAQKRTKKVAINASRGRIGSLSAMQFLRDVDWDNLDLVGAFGTNAVSFANLLKVESVHGQTLRKDDEVNFGQDEIGDYVEIKIKGKGTKKIHTFNIRPPKETDKNSAEMIPTEKFAEAFSALGGVDIMIDATAPIKFHHQLVRYIEAGAKKVIKTAPSKQGLDGIQATPIVVGVNHDQIPSNINVFDQASCTTGSTGSVYLAILQELNAILLAGDLTSAHSSTGSNAPVDKQERTSKKTTLYLNAQKATTGAAKALGPILPEVEGKIFANSIRLPLANGSMSISKLTLRLPEGEKLTAKSLNSKLRKASKSSHFKGVFSVGDNELSATQIIGRGESAIVFAPGTRVRQLSADDNTYLVTILTWYDNEWGYTNRPIDLAHYLGEQIDQKEASSSPVEMNNNQLVTAIEYARNRLKALSAKAAILKEPASQINNNFEIIRVSYILDELLEFQDNPNAEYLSEQEKNAIVKYINAIETYGNQRAEVQEKYLRPLENTFILSKLQRTAVSSPVQENTPLWFTTEKEGVSKNGQYMIGARVDDINSATVRLNLIDTKSRLDDLGFSIGRMQGGFLDAEDAAFRSVFVLDIHQADNAFIQLRDPSLKLYYLQNKIIEHFEGSAASSPIVHYADLTSIPDSAFEGRLFGVRVDYNVPLDDNGMILDDIRIRRSLETLRHITSRGGKVVLTSHLGRPKGKVVKKMSLRPAAERLQELLKGETVVYFPGKATAQEAQREIVNMRNGEILVLENTRFHPAETILADKEKALKKAKTYDEIEKARDEYDAAVRFHAEYGEALYAGIDYFALDGFSVAHRAHASVVGAPKGIPRYAGFLVQNELRNAERLKNAAVVVMGGAKADKISSMGDQLKRPELRHLLIGTATSNAFFKAQGIDIGASIGAGSEEAGLAEKLLKNPSFVEKASLPTDVVIASKFEDAKDTEYKVIQAGEAVPQGWMIVDIGPETKSAYNRILKAIPENETIFWNGPLGAIDKLSFAKNSDIFDGVTAFLGLGGGETGQVAEDLGIKYDFRSTAGGAFLENMTGKILPGIAQLQILDAASSPIRKILIVEDQDGLRTVIKEMVKHTFGNIAIITAENGVAGLEAFQSHGDIDLIFTDYQMPRMDGEEFAESVIQMRPGVPIVLISGDPSNRVRTQDASGKFGGLFFKVYNKPFKLEQLADVKAAFEQEFKASSPVSTIRLRNEISQVMLENQSLVGLLPYKQLQTLMAKVVYASGEANVSFGDFSEKLRHIKKDLSKVIKERGDAHKMINTIDKIIAFNIERIRNLFPNHDFFPASVVSYPSSTDDERGRITKVNTLLNLIAVGNANLTARREKLIVELSKTIDRIENKRSSDLELRMRNLELHLIHSSASSPVRVDDEIKDAISSPVNNDKTVGGINLNPELLDLQIKRDGNGVPLPVNLQPVRTMHIDGFVPIIINITPVVNLPLLLGFADKDPSVDSANTGSNQSASFDLSLADPYRNRYAREYSYADADNDL